MGTGVIPAPPQAPDGVNAIGDPNGVPQPVPPGDSGPDSQGFDTVPAPDPGSGERGALPPSRGGDDRVDVPPPAQGDTDEPGTPGDSDTGAPEDADKPAVPDDSATPASPGTAVPDAPPSSKAPSESKKPPRAETPSKPDTPKPPSLSEAAKVEAEVLELVNKERAKAGCDPLKLDRKLAKLARDFSVDMALRGFFAHLDPDGDNPWDRAEAAGIGDLGAENIARGQLDAKSVMEDWMNSPGHRANILSCEFKTLGVGVHFGLGGPWWTQNFGL